MTLDEYFSQRNYYKCIHKIDPGLGFHDVKWIVYLGNENSDYELTVSHITLSRESQDAEGIKFPGRQNTEMYLNESKIPLIRGAHKRLKDHIFMLPKYRAVLERIKRQGRNLNVSQWKQDTLDPRVLITFEESHFHVAKISSSGVED
jgi:hypothetical protein